MNKMLLKPEWVMCEIKDLREDLFQPHKLNLGWKEKFNFLPNEQNKASYFVQFEGNICIWTEH